MKFLLLECTFFNAIVWYQTIKDFYHGKKDVAPSVEGSEPNDLAPTHVREKEILVRDKNLYKDGFAMTVKRHLSLWN